MIVGSDSSPDRQLVGGASTQAFSGTLEARSSLRFVPDTSNCPHDFYAVPRQVAEPWVDETARSLPDTADCCLYLLTTLHHVVLRVSLIPVADSVAGTDFSLS